MIRLEDTSGGAVSAAIAAERHRMGSPATGMVLTLLILSDEEAQADATAAAVGAARQHPMRIVTLIPRPGKHETRLDAEISVGGDDGPGEVAVLRLRGLLAEHANSVAVPLLLSDTPVVASVSCHNGARSACSRSTPRRSPSCTISRSTCRSSEVPCWASTSCSAGAASGAAPALSLSHHQPPSAPCHRGEPGVVGAEAPRSRSHARRRPAIDRQA